MILELHTYFFANDNLLFVRTFNQDCEKVKNVLKSYEESSRQLINYDKSILLFSSNTYMERRNVVKEYFFIRVISGPKKQLGLLTRLVEGRKEHSKVGISTRLSNWSGRVLSMGGKKVFIKAVLQSISSYAMSCFKLPLSLCQEINSILSNYWWKQRSNSKGIHWIRWQQMCNAKGRGGMGF